MTTWHYNADDESLDSSDGQRLRSTDAVVSKLNELEQRAAARTVPECCCVDLRMPDPVCPVHGWAVRGACTLALSQAPAEYEYGPKEPKRE